jgi:hypothetical protein
MYRVLLFLLLLAGVPEALAVPVYLPVVELLSSQEEPNRYYLLQLSNTATKHIQAQPDLWSREISLSLPVPTLVAIFVEGCSLVEEAAHSNRTLIQLAPKTSPPFIG